MEIFLKFNSNTVFILLPSNDKKKMRELQPSFADACKNYFSNKFLLLHLCRSNVSHTGKFTFSNALSGPIFPLKNLTLTLRFIKLVLITCTNDQTSDEAMKTTQISFEVSETLLDVLNESREQFVRQVRLFAALQLFKNHKLSIGKAAELAGMSKDRFVIELDNHAIALIDYDPAELEEELGRFES